MRMIDGLRRWSDPKSARPAAATTSQTCITHKSFLRFTMSVRAPAGNVNRKKGSEAAEDNSESSKGEGVIVFITQVAAMSWAETQHPETTLASQSLRKTGFCSASQIEVELLLIGLAPATEQAPTY